MQPDFPAAHSMDTYWFAVDARGQVAVFESGEPGHVPDGPENDIFEELYRLYFNESLYEENAGWSWDPEECARRLGLTFYHYPDDYSLLRLLYERTVQPEIPLHIDMLPFHLRIRCSFEEFHELRFNETEFLQPQEFFSCISYDDEHAVAYLAADGETVRPMEGREDQFADFVKQLCEKESEEAARLRFEGPTE